jgi:thiamine-monophosphate kinase
MYFWPCYPPSAYARAASTSSPADIFCLVGSIRYSVFAVPLAEKALIARIRAQTRRNPAIPVGIGDDCAVLQVPSGQEVLLTTDFSLEDVHFRRSWHAAEVVGHRCLTRGLSDIAAMGGEPVAAFLSLAVPARLPQKWIDRFLDGFLALAKQFRVPLVGGDTAQSPAGILADIVVLGSVPRGRAILRSGARPGDLLYVTGELGGGADALHQLFAGKRIKPEHYPRHFHPIPRIAIGRYLREHRLATAMIDLSDGLSTDLAHISDESGIGAEILADSIPRARVGGPSRTVDLKDALHGGDDYELLFTTPPRKHVPARIAGVRVTPIGRITRGKKILLIEGSGRSAALQPEGWEHFHARAR